MRQISLMQQVKYEPLAQIQLKTSNFWIEVFLWYYGGKLFVVFAVIACRCQFSGRLIVVVIRLIAGQQEIYQEKLVYSCHPVSNRRKRIQKIKSFDRKHTSANVSHMQTYVSFEWLVYTTFAFASDVCVLVTNLCKSVHTPSAYICYILFAYTFAWSQNRTFP